MKRIAFQLLFYMMFSSIYPQLTDSIIDIRDGQVYKIVKIGSQWWMAENLKATKYGDGNAIPLVTEATAWSNLTTPGYCWYDNDTMNKATYGALYNWHTVNTNKLCPTNWHVPSDIEWKELEIYLGLSQVEADTTGWRGNDEGGKLKETGTTYWTNPNTGATNESGFTALPGGDRINNGSFAYLGYLAYFWSSTESNSNEAWHRFLNYDNSDINRFANSEAYGFSVRCIKDPLETLNITFDVTNCNSIGGNDGSIDLTVTGGLSPFYYLWSTDDTIEDLTNLSSGVYSVTVTDARDSTVKDSIRVYDTFMDERNEKRYRAITIGDQTWMADNLNYYSQSGSWYYNNDSIAYSTKYGRLYNWAASMNIDQSYLTTNYTTIYPHQGICPVGWHIPSDQEWKILEIYLGMTPVEADREGLDRGTDQGAQLLKGGSSGFEALLSGHRSFDDQYYSLEYGFTIHTSSEYSALAAWNRQIRIDLTGINRGAGTEGKKNAYPVRCLKDYEVDVLQVQIEDSLNITCHGFANGIAKVSALGGTLPYSYIWDDDANSTTATATGLVANRWYHVTVTDQSLQTARDSIMLSEPEQIKITADYSKRICPGSTDGYVNLDISGGTQPYEYSWSTGAITSSLNGLSPGKYKVSITDKNGCIAKDSIAIDSIVTFQDSEICMVSVNNSNRIIVVWEKTYNKGIASYNIYREQSKNNYIKIATVPFDNLSVYEDKASLPDENAHFYKISITDSCGNISQLGPYHKSIHLQTGVGLSKEVNLSWDDYEGFDYYEYEIYRGKLLTELSSIRTISSNVRSWTDKSPPSGQNYYRILVVKPEPCFPTQNKADKYSSPFSNYDEETIVGMDEITLEGLVVYPNPFSESTVITFPNHGGERYQLIVTDLSGRIVSEVSDITASELILERGELPAGLYLIELRGTNIYKGKIIIE